MKLTKISLAMAGVLAASNAFALSPTAIDPQNPTANDIVIHYGGATAQSQTVKDLTSTLCQAGTRDEYNNDPADPTHLAITCTLAAPAALANKNLYFSYYLNGGSVYGVTPVADQVPLNYMGVNPANGGNCTETAPGSHSWTCANQPANQYSVAPVAGGSDVEPAMFKGSNVAGLAFPAPSAAGLANLTVSPGFEVIFGIAVNNALLDPTADNDGDGNPDYPNGTGTIKSLSKSSIAAIFAGSKVLWEQVPEFGHLEDLVTGANATDIQVCRRKAGSGTQASAQAYFLNQECSDTGRTFVTAATSPGALPVQEISSSTKILTQCEEPSNQALAISSLEKQPNRADDKYGHNWEYVAIDGILPTEENAALGKYDYMFENSMQYNNAYTNADQKAFLNELFAAAKESSVLAGLPGVLGVPDFVVNTPGDLTDSNGNGVYLEYLPSNPVAWTTRDTQACKKPLAVFP